MATNPTVVVVGGEAQNTEQSSEREPSDSGQENALRQAERYGAMEAAYQQAQDRIAALELKITQLESIGADVSALRSEISALRSDLMEEPETDVTLVTPEPEPEPEPAQPEPEPETPKQSTIEFMLRL